MEGAKLKGFKESCFELFELKNYSGKAKVVIPPSRWRAKARLGRARAGKTRPRANFDRVKEAVWFCACANSLEANLRSSAGA